MEVVPHKVIGPYNNDSFIQNIEKYNAERQNLGQRQMERCF